MEDRIVDVDEETGGVIRPPPPPPPEELAPPQSGSIRDVWDRIATDVRGRQRVTPPRIAADTRGSFRALRERMRAREESDPDPDMLAEETEMGMEMGLRPREITTRLGKLSADMYGVPYAGLRRGQRVKVKDAFKRGGGV